MSDEPTTDEIERALKQADCSVYYDRTIGSPEVHIKAEFATPGDVLRQAYRAMRDLYLERQTTLADAPVTFGDLEPEDEFRDTPGGPIYWKTGESTAVRVNVGTSVGLEVQVVDVDPDTEVEPVEDV